MPELPSLLSPPVEAMRQPVVEGVTRPLAWRLEQLDRLEALLQTLETDLLAALANDLGKPPLEAYYELVGVREELKHSRLGAGRRGLFRGFFLVAAAQAQRFRVPISQAAVPRDLLPQGVEAWLVGALAGKQQGDGERMVSLRQQALDGGAPGFWRARQKGAQEGLALRQQVARDSCL